MYQKTPTTQQMKAARGEAPADIVFKNASILNVFTGEWMNEDVAIVANKIVGIGSFSGRKEIDATGKWIVPGFIDAHVHIESSMLTPSQFSKVVVPRGVTTVIADPHEIANVSGAEGIQFMLDDSEGIPLNVQVMLPSCVPATAFENAGAVLRAEHLQPFYQHPRVLGLAEVMDYPSVLNEDSDMLRKISEANCQGKRIDGHCAGLQARELNAYATVNIRTDHECTTVEEVRERLNRGFYVSLREGSAAKDLRRLLPAVTMSNARRLTFCTDDKHLDELLEKGSIDYSIRVAVEEGIPVETAIIMATLNAAECYGLSEKGAIAPGYDADFVILSDLDNFKIEDVWIKGVHYEEKEFASTLPTDSLLQTVHIPHFNEKQLTLPLETKETHVIEIIPNSITTRHTYETLHDTSNFQSCVEQDLAKIAVVERHRETGNVGVGIVRGFQLKKGAFATTVSHDSHNIVAVGTNDADMTLAISTLKNIGGGLVVVCDGEILSSLSLQLSGLMSLQHFNDVYKDVIAIDCALHTLGVTKAFNPFLTLSFLALPVIPNLKITDQGLFSVSEFSFINVQL